MYAMKIVAEKKVMNFLLHDKDIVICKCNYKFAC